MRTNNNKLALLVSLAIGMVILFWSFVTPAFEFPDEQAHFGSVEFLTQNGRMPIGEEMDVTKEMKETQVYLGVFRNGLGQNKYTYHPEYRTLYSSTYMGPEESIINTLNTMDFRDSYVATEAARYPRAYYDYSSFWDRLVTSFSIFDRLFVVRLGSVLLAIIMAYAVWQTGYLIFGKKTYATTLTLLAMLQPMMSFLSAGINSDNLHNLLFFIIIYGCLKIIIHGFGWQSLLLIAGAATLDIFTKPQGFIAFLIIGLAIILSVIRKRNWSALIIIFCLFMVVLYLTRSQFSMYLGFITVGNTKGLSFVEYVRFSSNKLIAQNAVWYWGVFKWLGVVLPPIYWRVANRIVLVGIFGLLVYAWKALKHKKIVIDPYLLSFSLISSLIYATAIYWFDWQYNKTIGYSIGIQARYFFPTIVCHMIILMTGILSIGWSNVSRIWLRRVLVIFIAWIQLGGMWRVISSYYDISSVQAFITQVSQYKPWYAKGEWWYLWGSLYLGSLTYLTWLGVAFHKKNKKYENS